MADRPVRRRHLLVGLAVLAVVFGATVPLAGPAAGAGRAGTVLAVPGATAVPGSYVVVLKPGAAAGAVSALTARHGGEVRAVWSHAVQGFAVGAGAATAARIAADP